MATSALAPLSSPLADIRRQWEEASTRAQEVVAGLSLDQLGRRPTPTSWSIAECLAHLTLTTDAYLPRLRQALATGRDQRATQPASYRMDWLGRLEVWWLEPPYRMRSKTPASFVPGAQDPARALPDFLDGQQQLLALLPEANGLALDRLIIVSPFVNILKNNAYSAFVIIAAHERRHLWQAERARARL